MTAARPCAMAAAPTGNSGVTVVNPSVPVTRERSPPERLERRGVGRTVLQWLVPGAPLGLMSPFSSRAMSSSRPFCCTSDAKSVLKLFT